MTTKGFLIADSYVDESVGIYQKTWTLEGDFHFDTKEDIEDFKIFLKVIFESQCGDKPIVQTIEEIEDEVKAENEMHDKIFKDYEKDKS